MISSRPAPAAPSESRAAIAAGERPSAKRGSGRAEAFATLKSPISGSVTSARSSPA